MDLIGLVPSFGGLVWTVIAFVVALSVIVAIHEYGHYIVGRWTGIHAEVFSLGFGPVIYSRVDRRGTRWQIAALPFGGYVKFLGDSNAASGKDGEAISALSEGERRHTMHGAPLWARALTVAAGPAFNFISSVIILTGLVLWSGVFSDETVVGKTMPLPFEGQHLQPGDRILSLNGEATPDLARLIEVAGDLPAAAGVTYTVERAGQQVTFDGPHPLPPMAAGVQPQSAAFDASLRAGDVILAVDGTPVSVFAELPGLVAASEGRSLRLTVWRAGETFDTTLTPRKMDLPRATGGFETRWLIGLNGGLGFEPETRQPGLFEAVGIAGQQTWRIASTSLSGLWHMVAGKISTCNLRGPIGIAESSGAAASHGTQTFIQFIAMLSVAVGLINLFPIPVLDGGHLVFHAYEAVTGKPPSDRALQRMMMVGLALLLTLMVFAITNDLFCP